MSDDCALAVRVNAPWGRIESKKTQQLNLEETFKTTKVDWHGCVGRLNPLQSSWLMAIIAVWFLHFFNYTHGLRNYSVGWLCSSAHTLRVKWLRSHNEPTRLTSSLVNLDHQRLTLALVSVKSTQYILTVSFKEEKCWEECTCIGKYPDSSQGI